MSLRAYSILFLLVAVFCGCRPSEPQTLVYPEQGSEAAALFLSRCATCHGAPLPGSRKKQQWGNILYRMQTNITVNGLTPLTDAEQKILLDYLERNAPQ